MSANNKFTFSDGNEVFVLDTQGQLERGVAPAVASLLDRWQNSPDSRKPQIEYTAIKDMVNLKSVLSRQPESEWNKNAIKLIDEITEKYRAGNVERQI